MGRLSDIRFTSAAANRPSARGGSRSGMVQLSMQGDLEIANALVRIPVEMRKTIIPSALRFAGKIIVERARALAPEGFLATPAGSLKRAIGLILRRGRDRVPYIVFGARRGFARPVERPILIGSGGIDQRIRGFVTRRADPANYAHLVEFGHFVVRPVRGTSRRKNTSVSADSGRQFVAARPFLRPAIAGSKNEVKARLIQGINQGLQKAWARIATKNTRKAA